MLTGINIDATLKLAQAIKTPIIASGGLNSLKDVQAVCSQLAPEGIIGAIAGRALYEGKLDLKKAQATADKALAKDWTMGLPKRIIPCLDVAAGRVVKGVNFVGLRDAGDPVEIARATTSRAPTKSAFSTSREPR